MESKATITLALSVLGAIGLFGWAQAPPAATRTGPGVQAAQDAKEPDVLKTCKVPPPARGGRGGGAPGRGAAAGPPPLPAPHDYKVTAIPGVVADGVQWKEFWKVSGNNADGIIGTKDGGLLIAQNDNSAVVKLDKNGKASTAYSGTNTGGALSMNSKGVLFLNNRGLNADILELAPRRQSFANKYNGDSFDCIGGVLNDLAADSKGGVYFTMGGLYYADPKGVVKSYGKDLRTNGIVLSPDEKVLYVTNGPTLAAFDVQPDGSLNNQREFAKFEGGGDGSTVDAMGRIYVTAGYNVHVISPEGKLLGSIPTPRSLISAAFSGKGKKTLYVVARTNDDDWILGIPMLTSGFKGRAK
ncbi:MAG TPA: SMP-30/gluconolactonase/LRE family protein [Bryobacteraceae bacterium]|jgi:gluconolactonase|nr:SMP-30/gluconolactonase/LRE family protein [Bryobacteraceae bacterium]